MARSLGGVETGRRRDPRSRTTTSWIGPARNVAPPASCTINSRSGCGGAWAPASIRRYCTPSLREPLPGAWSAGGETALDGAVEPIRGAVRGTGDRMAEGGQPDRRRREGVPEGAPLLTLVNDLQRGRVLYVAEDRKQSSLDGFWKTLTAEQLGGIEAVAMDRWDQYICAESRGGGGRQDRIRQVPCGAAPGGRRGLEGDPLRLAEESGGDGAEGPQGVRRAEKQRIERRRGRGS